MMFRIIIMLSEGDRSLWLYRRFMVPLCCRSFCLNAVLSTVLLCENRKLQGLWTI